jgi:ATP-dependent Lon protease
MPRRYNLRPRRESLHWIQDDTLIDEETDSEDSTYVSPSEEEESEEVSLVDEDEETDDDEEPTSSAIRIPMPPKGARVTIEIDNTCNDDSYDADEDEEEEDQPFLDYLMNKYVPASRVASRRKKEDKTPDSPALNLDPEEREYFDDLSRPKQKKLNKQMKQLAGLISNGDVPYKFRILDLPVSDAIKASVIKKIDVLNKMDMDNGESHKLRTWVDGFLNIPFGKVVPLPVKLDDGAKPCADFLAETRQTLDKAVYGMHGAKTQIMQILAQWISNPSSVGNVIALKGPMGVGKTSFARNGVANVLKRPFEFFSLGGAADASNFVGHSYTYEGAQWGRIADSLMSARCMNPVMYFDELDKVSTTAHGEEIVSMLIHLTDRSQNSQFHDRYFAGVDFDLSQCLFVFSFNDETKVHPILRDRMQVIHCAGYSSDEKKVILNQYVWPQILDRINLSGHLTIGDDAVKFLIEHYSKEEEGVRTLIRAVETLVTRINLLRIADEETAKSYPFYMKITMPMQIKSSDVEHLLTDMAKQTNESWRHLYV